MRVRYYVSDGRSVVRATRKEAIALFAKRIGNHWYARRRIAEARAWLAFRCGGMVVDGDGRGFRILLVNPDGMRRAADRAFIYA